jgi:hypothetical protein
MITINKLLSDTINNCYKDFNKFILGLIDKNFGVSYDDNLVLAYKKTTSPHKTTIFNNKFETIYSFGDQYLFDNLNMIEKSEWEDVIVNKYYEGIFIIVLFINSKWYIITKKSIRNVDIENMFMEIIKDKFSLTDLNVEYIYHFNMINSGKNKRKIVKYGYTPILYLVKVCNKYCSEDIENINVDGIDRLLPEKFTSKDILLNNMDLISKRDESIHKITLRGYTIIYKNMYIKLETDVYKRLKDIIPIYKNKYIGYLELYQKNCLTFYLQFFMKNAQTIINMINITMKTISKEMSTIYFLTRFKQNPIMYQNLTVHYKKIIFNIHGLYISTKNEKYVTKANINCQVIYNYLKTISVQDLVQIFYDREKNKNILYSVDCIYTDKLVYFLNF